MALMWVDSFTQYGFDETLLLNGLYAENHTDNPSVVEADNALVVDPDPLATGNVFRVGNVVMVIAGLSSANMLRRTFPVGMTTGGVALRLWLEHLPYHGSSNMVVPIRFSDGANTTQMFIEVDPSGRLLIWRGSITFNSINRSEVIGTTAVPVITSNAWQHLEAKVFFSSTVGTIEIRVQGVTVLSLSNINTSPTDNQSFNWTACNWTIASAGAPLSPSMYIKDLVSWNTLGSYNNDFMGTVQVAPLLPNGDITLGDWGLVGGATGSDILDNVPPIDTSYIFADPAGTNQAEFNLQPVADDTSSIRAAVVTFRANKSDAGDGSIKVGLKRAGSEILSGDIPLTTAMTYYQRVFETDPVTGVPITPVQMNDMTMVIDRTL